MTKVFTKDKNSIYYVTDEEFKDLMIKRDYKKGTISKEDAFLELI